MLVPETYQAALLLMLLSMLCWGSWANTLKLCQGYRFQLFYWDYAIGVLLGAVVLGLTAGSHGSGGNPYLTDLVQSPVSSIKMAALGGVVFNVANLLLVAAIDVAGLAVAFPVGIGIALIVGSVWSYVVAPTANALLLFGGVALVTVAILLDAAAYRKRETKARAATTRGITLSLIAGLLMGSFYPLVARAMQGEHGYAGPGPYAIATFFSLGVLLSTFPANWLLMLKPFDGKARVRGSEYWGALWRWHFAGMLGGMIWCAGAVTNFLGSGAHKVGPAVSYSIGQGATMVSACWGIFVWHEFAGAPRMAKRLLILMFAFFLFGLGAIAVAPLY
ncbi:MAG TPA: AcrB/AcrD/AcrF family protein [Terracidiphilus sp.]|jgi:glucose uptake protein|nr:AcrB/AcrD/AcrF family protein [Terracidiphilus sp.]